MNVIYLIPHLYILIIYHPYLLKYILTYWPLCILIVQLLFIELLSKLRVLNQNEILELVKLFDL